MHGERGSYLFQKTEEFVMLGGKLMSQTLESPKRIIPWWLLEGEFAPISGRDDEDDPEEEEEDDDDDDDEEEDDDEAREDGGEEK